MYNIIMEGTLSLENHDTTQQPFHLQDIEKINMIDFNNIDVELYLKKIENIPYKLKVLFKIIGNPKREFYTNKNLPASWTVFSLDKIVNTLVPMYQSENQLRAIDFAMISIGMGHIIVASVDPQTKKIYYRHDGGSNGYDRIENFNFACKYLPKNEQLYDIDHWINIIKEKEMDGFEMWKNNKIPLIN